jgi:hypothetical protein
MLRSSDNCEWSGSHQRQPILLCRQTDEDNDASFLEMNVISCKHIASNSCEAVGSTDSVEKYDVAGDYKVFIAL